MPSRKVESKTADEGVTYVLLCDRREDRIGSLRTIRVEFDVVELCIAKYSELGYSHPAQSGNGIPWANSLMPLSCSKPVGSYRQAHVSAWFVCGL